MRSLSFELLEVGIEQSKVKGFDLIIPEILDEVLTNFGFVIIFIPNIVEDKFDETRIPRLRILIKIATQYPQDIAMKVIYNLTQ